MSSLRRIGTFLRRHTWPVIFIGAVVLVFVLGVAYFLQGETARAIMACKNDSQTQAPQCYADLLSDILAKRGLSATLDTVEQIAASDSNFAHYCHNNMHILGHAAYAQYEKTGTIQVSPALVDCGFGFYHGFMEEMFAQTGTVSGAEAFCKSLGSETAESNCYHGIGHGVTDGSDAHLWGNAAAIVAPGLTLCEKIAPNDEMIRSCAMGVFNSVELMYFDPQYKLAFGNKPYALCADKNYNVNEKEACYTEMSVLVMDYTHDDFTNAFSYVKDVEPAYQEWATRYLAIYSFSGAKAPDPVSVLAICESVVGKYADACMQGLAQGLIVYGKPGPDQYDGAISFCKNSALTSAQSNVCIHTVLVTDTYSAADRARVCGYFPRNDVPQACISATSTSS